MTDKIRERLGNLFGISLGDENSVKRYRFIILYLVLSALRSSIRLLANHCIVPSLRVALFSWSGIKIGKRVQINMNVNFLDGFCPGLIRLEDEVAVAPFVSFVADSHPNNSVLYRDYGFGKSGVINIRSGAWLGVGSVILPGITVGKSAVVGANAVITKDVEDYAIMVGVPARKIGDVRFYRNTEKSMH